MTPTDTRLFSSLSHKRSSSSVSYNKDSQLTVHESNPKRQKTRNLNAKFDSMIETMAIIPSVQHSSSSDDGRQSDLSDANWRTTNKPRHRSYDRPYSPLIPANVGSELSFIKMAKRNSLHGDRPSSESNTSKDPLEPPCLGPSCSPLPSWLATTFLSLSRKHPLRLLLPPDFTETHVPEKISKPKQMEYKIVAAHVPSTSDGIFAFEVPESSSNDRDASASSENTVFGQLLPPEIYVNDERSAYMDSPEPDSSSRCLVSEAYLDNTNAAYNDFPLLDFASQPLPFSTPGPGSLLGSTADTDNVETHLEPVYSSPTVFAIDSYIEKDSDLVEPDMTDFCTDTNPFTNFQERHTDNSDDSVPLSPHLACNPLFSNIFATPGPGYCTPLALHFDLPTEDPLSSNPSSSPGYQISYDDVDFRWQAFDRGKLTIPKMPGHGAFVFGASGSDCKAVIMTEGEMDLQNVHTKNFEAQGFPSPVFLNLLPSSPVPPVTPSPFHVVAPSGTDIDRQPQSSPFVPDPQEPEQQQQPITPKKPAFAPVPGIYISPIQNRDQTHSPKSDEGSNRNAAGNKNTSKQMMLTTADNVRRELHAAGIDALDAPEDFSQHSHASNDRIESWGQVVRCEELGMAE